MPKTYLAFDYGTKRTGLAVGNDITYTAQALPAIATHLFEKPAKQIGIGPIKKIITEWKVDELIFGEPLDMQGKETKSSKHIKMIGTQISTLLGLPVRFVDERYTSGAADQILRSQQQAGKILSQKKITLRDSIAAQLILECYFSSPGRS